MTDREILEAMRSMMEAERENTRRMIEPINTKLDTMQDSINALKADMAHHNHTVEPQLKIIREGLDGWSERARQLDRLENKVEDHGNRILALEFAVKAK